MSKWRHSSLVHIYSILVLVVSVQVGNSILAGNQVSAADSSATTTQILVLDIYSDQGGQGSNKTMGTYTIGDTVKFYINVNINSTIRENIIAPDGSVWVRMSGSVNSGTIVEYFETQYPIGTWAISVEAQAGNEVVSDTAPFEVVDKKPYICTKTSLFNTSGSPGEIGFTGKVVKTYHYPVGGVHRWDIQVDHLYFGSDMRNQTMHVQILTVTYTPGHAPGYLDDNVTLGDMVAVYGLLDAQSVSLNGSISYYIVRLSTLCEQTHPQTPPTGSKETGLHLGVLLILTVLLMTALIIIRKKHPISKERL